MNQIKQNKTPQHIGEGGIVVKVDLPAYEIENQAIRVENAKIKNDHLTKTNNSYRERGVDTERKELLMDTRAYSLNSVRSSFTGEIVSCASEYMRHKMEGDGIESVKMPEGVKNGAKIVFKTGGPDNALLYQIDDSENWYTNILIGDILAVVK